jgi:hypothetical protein
MPSNSPRARCALRQMTANPSPPCISESAGTSGSFARREDASDVSKNETGVVIIDLLIASDYGRRPASGLGKVAVIPASPRVQLDAA